MVSLKKITTKGKAIYLAYDQGLEHGPETDFNDKNVDPLYIIDIAKKAKLSALIFQKGIAEKYNKEIRKSKIPLIVKLNGKTRLVNGEPKSAQICTVKEAMKLGASGVGFTIYIGSKYEEEMMEEFAKIQKEAHIKKLPVILWVYPRGGKVKKDVSRELMSYSARVGLELGADVIKIKSTGQLKDLNWAAKSAGRAKIVISGGKKQTEKEFLKDVKTIAKSNASGLAVGRNIWQSEDPIKLSKEIKKIILK